MDAVLVGQLEPATVRAEVDRRAVGEPARVERVLDFGAVREVLGDGLRGR